MLEIRLFGSPQVLVDGKLQSKIPTRKSILLLARLVLNPSKPQDRNALAFDLWPDVPESRARRNLNTEIWRLRQVLGEAIRADSKSVQFAPEADCFVDAEAFESVAANASIGELENAVVNYHSDFLAGHYDDWVLVKREFYQDRLMHYLDQCARHYQANSSPRKAIEFVRRILFYNPLHEESHQRLMRLFAQAGDHASAIQQYRQCAEMLERELGLKPMPETEALYQRIVEESQQRVGRLGPIVQPEKVFVGRSDSLRELDVKWAEVLQGQTQSAIVTGESGIGKTRLVEHWLEGVHHRGVILRGHCYEVDRRVPYRPITEILRAAMQEYGDVELKNLPAIPLNEIGKLMPDLILASSKSEPAALTPAQARERLVNSLVMGLRAWSSPEKPLIVFLDDMQWADDETMDVVRALLTRGDDAPMLFIATHRPDPLEVAGDRDARIKDLESASLALNSLSRLEVVDMIRRMGNLPDAPQAFAARVYAETEGNPLFVVESLRGLFDSGHLSTRADGIWTISLDGPISEMSRLPLSVNLRQTIMKRVERLNAEQQKLLALAAVIGREFDAEILRSVTGMNDSAIQDVLTGLLRYGLIREISSSTRFDFSHVKIQEVLLASMADSQRQTLHLQVARYLESKAAGDSSKLLEQLAYHFHQGGDHETALEFFRQAGEQAISLHAYKVAASYFDSALALCTASERADQRFSLLMKSYLCLWSTDLDHLRLDRILEQARKLAEETQKSDFLAQAYFYSGLNFVSQGGWVDAEGFLRRALDHAKASGLIDIEMRASLELANMLEFMRRAEEAIPRIELALELAQRAGDFRIEGRARWDMAQASTGVADQARVGSEIVQRALDANALALLVEIGSGTVGILWRAGDPGGAIELGERLLAYGREQGSAGFVRSVSRILSRIHSAIGEYATALLFASESLRASRLTNYRYGEMRSLICMALANAGLGFFDDAMENMNRAMELCEQIGSKTDLLTARVETVDLLLRGDPAYLPRAESLARQTLDESRDAGLHSAEIFALSYLSQILLSENRLEEAIQSSSQSVAVMEDPENRDIGLEPLVYFNHYRALQRAGDETAVSFLQRARGLLYCSAITLPPPLRRSFLRRVIWNRLISQA